MVVEEPKPAGQAAASRLVVSWQAGCHQQPLQMLQMRRAVVRRPRRLSLDQVDARSQQLLLQDVRRPRHFSLDELDDAGHEQRLLLLRRAGVGRPRVSWCPTVEFVSRTAGKTSSVRRTGFVNRELTRLVERNYEETDKIVDIIDPWYKYREHLPAHLGTRLLVDSTAHIFTVS